MKKLLITAVTVMCGASSVSFVGADEATLFVPYDRIKGELSPGTQAPTREAMVAAIKTAGPTALGATLEYGEHVECLECVGLLHDKILNSSNAKVREMAAWWIRRHPYGFHDVFSSLRDTVANDANATRRARAAEALGEFMVPASFAPLKAAAAGDADTGVRAAAVRALGRLNYNHADLDGAMAGALTSGNAEISSAALSSISFMNTAGAQTQTAITTALTSSDAHVRRQAALQAGHHHVAGALAALSSALKTDTDRDVRQAAAWALGRLGSAEAKTALTEAQGSETDSLVKNAIAIALKM